jgi:hypothetical protein
MTFTAAGGAPALPTISITGASTQISTNGVSNLVFTATLSASSASTVSVSYTTQDGTAVAGTDYTLTSGTLNFPAGSTSQTITVPALGRATFKNLVTFSVVLSSPVNATIATGTATGTIIDAILPVSNISHITRTNSNFYLSFPTYSGLTYSLRVTNVAGLRTAVSTWPVAATTIGGNGSTLMLTDSPGMPDRVYVLQATRVP